MSPETFAALEPGVYTLSMDGEPKVVMITEIRFSNGGSERIITWDKAAGRMPDEDTAHIDWVRPLERQGGLSGAMYWGDEIR